MTKSEKGNNSVKGSIGLQWESRKNVEKGLLFCNDKYSGKEKKIRVLLIFILIPQIKFQDSISNC